MPDPRHRPFFGIGFGGYFAVLLAVAVVSWAMAANQSQTAITIGNAVPQVTGAAVNSGSPIILSPAGTSSVSVSFTVTDDNGCADVFFRGNVTTTLYRSGVSSTCATSSPSLANQSLLNCYVVATTTHNCPGANSTTTSANATATFSVWYFADPTDPSSTYSTHNWLAYVTARDGSSTSVSTSSVSGVELNTLLAIQLASTTLDYGSLNPGENTSSTNQSTTIINAGNSSTTLSVYGTAFVSGTSTMPTSSQHYATATFTYGVSDVQLQEAATAVAGFITRGRMLSPWITQNSLPSTIIKHEAVIYNNYIYSMGGEASDVFEVGTTTVFYAPITATGSVGAWATTTPLPSGVFYHVAFARNGFMYSLSGAVNSSTATTTVRYAPIHATGSLGAWATTTPLPAVRVGVGNIAYANNYLYIVGGMDPSANATSSVIYATLNSTGSIGAWAATTPLPQGRVFSHQIAYNNKLYAISGWTNVDGDATSSALYATINATGSIGSWTQTASLIIGRYWTNMSHNENVIYVTGGRDTGGASAGVATTQFTIINPDGSLAPWSYAESNLPATKRDHGQAISNGNIYVVGGTSGGVDSNGVYRAPVRSRNLYWGTAANATSTYANYTSSITYVANWTQ